MPRLPLRELEEVRKSPSVYRAKLDQSMASVYRGTYFGALRDAILRFHKIHNDIVQARAYLEVRLARFTDVKRCEQMMDWLEWYVEEYSARGWLMFETRLRIAVPLPHWAPTDLVCSGEVTRVDLVPTGGYAAWLIQSRGAADWFCELRMPLIQGTVAQHILKVPISEVSVGVYSLEEQIVDLRCYSQMEIDQAHSNLADLLRQMGYGA
jgi:hypothetical protein